jgi:4-coumarate--CoA ligase
MSSSTTYVSPFPPVPLAERSVFSHLFSSSDPQKVGRFPASFPAFIDAATGATLTRGQLKKHALSFAYGLSAHPRLLRQERGDTLIIYAPNSLGFVVVLFGTVAAGLRFSPANSAYVSKELQHQYTDSGARIIATTADGLPVVEQMFFIWVSVSKNTKKESSSSRRI